MDRRSGIINNKQQYNEMKKRMLLALGVLLMAAGVSAETFRVNNAEGSGAQFATYKDAENAASDGDVIIVDGSQTSYGEIIISKKITLKGPGYYLTLNEDSKEGASPATFDKIIMRAEGAKITGLYVTGTVEMRANHLIVTRCWIRDVSLCPDFSYTEDHISHGIIHQNCLYQGVSGDSYSSSATFMQVTNNIILNGYQAMFCNMDNSVISRNTAYSSEYSGVRQLSNCVIENNIALNIEDSYWYNRDNTYANNHSLTRAERELYGYRTSDRQIKEADAAIATDKGAFSGDDPYVLSGLPTGPYIQDIEMPESVVKGEDLKVTVKIGVSR